MSLFDESQYDEIALRNRFIFDASNILIALLRGEIHEAEDLAFRLTDEQRHEVAVAASLLTELTEGSHEGMH